MRLRLPDRGERGAVAVMTAVLMSVLLGVAALAVDITTQVNVRQKLFDTIDAAAQAGAYRLPGSGSGPSDDALFSAKQNDPALVGSLTPAVDFFCVVASKEGAVDTTQTPSTCYLAASKVTNVYPVPPARCNSKICAIPCVPAAGDVCNTIKVTATKSVPFSFAPAIGITAPGSTGSVSSAACKGVCGTIPINPMDIAVVADRTSSMSSDISKLIAGLVGPPTGTPGSTGMFQVMTPSQQYVSLGTIGRSKLGAASTSCPSQPWNDSYPAQKGPWMPVPFSTDYLLPGTATINTSSTLVKGVNCLTNTSSTGTWLASPMKAAARYLLGPSSPYDSTTSYPAGAPARTGTIRKAIIFETDGAPNESTVAGSTALTSSGDIGSSTGATACNNFNQVATNAKAKAVTSDPNILVVTVGFNLQKEVDHRLVPMRCDGTGTGSSARVIDVLAAAASPAPSGVASAAENTCLTDTERKDENIDRDYFFCAGTGTNMQEIYKTAFTQLANGIRLLKLP